MKPSTILWIVIAVYYAVVNILLFGSMGIDKRRAKRGSWRVKESTLLLLAFLGGAPGGLIGMRVFRHKTQKPKFLVGYPVALILHIALWVLIYYLRTR